MKAPLYFDFWECPMFIIILWCANQSSSLQKKKKTLGATTPKLIDPKKKESNHLNTYNKDTYIFIAECLVAFRYPSKYIRYNYLHEDTQASYR